MLSLFFSIKQKFLKGVFKLNRLLFKVYFYLYLLKRFKKIIEYFYKLQDTYLTLKWSRYQMDEATDLLVNFNPIINIPDQAYKTLIWQPKVFANFKRRQAFESICLEFDTYSAQHRNTAMRKFYAPAGFGDSDYLSDLQQQDVISLYKYSSFLESRRYTNYYSKEVFLEKKKLLSLDYLVVYSFFFSRKTSLNLRKFF